MDWHRKINRTRVHLGAIRRAILTPEDRYGPLRPYFFAVARKFTPEVSVATGAARFIVHTYDQQLSRAVFLNGDHDLPAMHRALSVLEFELGLPVVSGGRHTLIDVGANLGTTSVFALLECGFVRAVAIEPEPANLRLLRANLALNDLTDRCTVLPFAVSDRAGPVIMELSAVNSGDNRIRSSDSISGMPESFGESEWDCVQVESRSIDDLVATGLIPNPASIAVLWVDVQGYEGYVLKGASTLREAGVPAIIEFWPYVLRRAGCLELLLDDMALYAKVIDLGPPNQAFGPPRVVRDIGALVHMYPGDSYSDLLLLP